MAKFWPKIRPYTFQMQSTSMRPTFDQFTQVTINLPHQNHAPMISHQRADSIILSPSLTLITFTHQVSKECKVERPTNYNLRGFTFYFPTVKHPEIITPHPHTHAHLTGTHLSRWAPWARLHLNSMWSSHRKNSLFYWTLNHNWLDILSLWQKNGYLLDYEIWSVEN